MNDSMKFNANDSNTMTFDNDTIIYVEYIHNRVISHHEINKTYRIHGVFTHD